MAARVADGIRLAGHSIFLDSDREDGIAPGAAWQRTLFRELRICDAVVFLNSHAGQTSMWCHSELVVAAELGKRVYSLDLGPDLPPHLLLGSLQGIRFDSTVDDGVQRLAQGLSLDGLAGSARLRWERGRPPYPGLAAMDVADAGVFFGREAEVRDLVALVDGPLGQRDGDLVVVMGPSGAGKSSLVRAGLAARLAIPRSGWAVADPFEPGLLPLDRLQSRLTALVPGQLSESECRDRLRTDGLAAFGEWLTGHVEVPAKRLLVTLDQAEQLATVTSPGEQEEFLRVVGAGVGPGSPVTVVMTVRSDHFDLIQQLPVIGPVIRAPFVIAPISRSQLATVIEEPARRADLTFAPGLVNRLIDDAVRGSSGETADALPFLAFVLREMYDLLAAETRTEFTEADYERVGRIDGAIIRRAQAAEASLPPDSEPDLERMLPRFVTLSEERLPAARPVPRRSLTATEQEMAEKLQDQRLLVGTGDTVRLAHERLITAWPRLARALSDRRDDLLLQARLERQAADWQHGHGTLLGRDGAGAARAWLTRQGDDDSQGGPVGAYLRASQRALRRRRVQLVSVLSVIVALAVVVSVVAVVAGVQRSHAVSQSLVAQSEARLAQSEDMVTEATALLPADAPLAMLLSLQADERAPNLQAQSVLARAIQEPLRDLLTLPGSGSVAVSVAFSPDGRTLAVGDGNGDIDLRNAMTGRQIATLTAGPAGDHVGPLAFSPDGHTLAASDDNGHVQLWDLATRHRTANWTVVKGGSADDYVIELAFSPDGQTIAVNHRNSQVNLWDIATGRQTGTLSANGIVGSLAFSPDGRTLAIGGGQVSLWDLATRQQISSRAVNGLITELAFSPDGRTLAAGDATGPVGLLDIASGRQTALAENSPADSVTFSPDGRTLAVGDDGGHIGLWNAATGQQITILAEGSSVNGVAFSPDGRTLAAADNNGQIGLWNTSPEQRSLTLAEGGPVSAAAFSPDGRTLAVNDVSGSIALWNVSTGQRTAILATGDGANFAFSPDGRTVATGDVGQVRLWNLTTRKRTATLTVTGEAGNPVPAVAFSSDGRTVAASTVDGHIGLLDIATGRQTATLTEGNTNGNVAFSPDGRTVAAGDSTGEVRLWNAATGKRIAALAEGGGGGGAEDVVFSPDGQVLAVGDGLGGVGLWQVATGKRIRRLVEGNQLNSVAFSPDGRALLTADNLGNVDVWNAATGQRFADLTEAAPVITALFAPHGQGIVIGGENGQITVLRQDLTNFSPQFYRRLICGEVRENLTPAQWAQYAPGQPYQKTCP
jgi:WD40 repeat protein/energy-coupling factor transporter ATP-binding protein EcfA2